MIHIDSYWGDPDAGNSGYGEYEYGNNEDTASSALIRSCKYCGKKGLEWIEVRGGWRLGNSGGKIHECPERKSLLTKAPPRRAKVPISSKVYDLLSNAIQGNHLSEIERKEFDRLQKYFKDNGLTVNDLLKKTHSIH